MGRDQAEIANAYSAARQTDVQNLIERIEHSEKTTLRPNGSLREHKWLARCLSVLLVEARHVAWIILSIAVHHHHAFTSEAIVNVCEADRNGALVADVSPQMHDMNLAHTREGAAAHVFIRR